MSRRYQECPGLMAGDELSENAGDLRTSISTLISHMKIKNRLADVGLISAAVTAHRAGSSWLAALYVTKALPLSSPMLVCAWSNPRFDVYESRCNLNLSRDSKVRNISLSRDCRPHFDHLRAHPSSAIREGVTGRICIGWACDCLLYTSDAADE